MKLLFERQACLITGAGSGIGRALAFELGKRGALIAALDRDGAALEALENDLRKEHVASAWETADVADRGTLGPAVERLARRLGPIEILVANAGIGAGNSALAYQAEEFEETIQVNLIGVSNTIATVLPGMIERRRGRIAAISSIASYRGMPMLAAYSASKAGVNAMMDSLRVELGPLGIICTTICPGWVRTPLTERTNREARQQLGRLVPRLKNMMPVEEAARRIVAALVRGQPFAAFPAWLRWRGALLRWLPSRMSDRMIRAWLPEVPVSSPLTPAAAGRSLPD